MSDWYAKGRFKMGDLVRATTPTHLVDKVGVVAQMSDKILNLIKPNEVPVRYVVSAPVRYRSEETMVYLLDASVLQKVSDDALASDR